MGTKISPIFCLYYHCSWVLGYVEMLGLILIPIHLKETVELLLIEPEQETDDSSSPATPIITFRQSLFTIVCEGVDI